MNKITNKIIHVFLILLLVLQSLVYPWISILPAPPIAHAQDSPPIEATSSAETPATTPLEPLLDPDTIFTNSNSTETIPPEAIPEATQSAIPEVIPETIISTPSAEIATPSATPTPSVEPSASPSASVSPLISPPASPSTIPNASIQPTNTPSPSTSADPSPSISPSMTNPTIEPTIYVSPSLVSEIVDPFAIDLSYPFTGTYVISYGFGVNSHNDYISRMQSLFGVDAHDGIDFATPIGTEIIATDAGTILSAGKGLYGTTIQIQHSWGISYYGHLSDTQVTAGTKVSKGEIIGLSGKSGFTTGPHLHFGIRPLSPNFQNGYHGLIDPLPYLSGDNHAKVLGTNSTHKHQLKRNTFKAGENIEITGDKNTSLQISIRNRRNQIFTPDFTIINGINNDTYVVYPPQNFEPGLYTMIITDNAGTTEEQDFTWGVLALNSNKSSYTIGETAQYSIAVLDDLGRIVCDANLTLTITDPSGNITDLSTNQGSITINHEVCSSLEVTQIPDYAASFQTSLTGIYQVLLTANTVNGQRQISDTFEVKVSTKYDVERISATRLYPLNAYPMDIVIVPQFDYQGLVQEIIPSDVIISNITPTPLTKFPDSINTLYMPKSSTPDSQSIEWYVDWKAGETYVLTYFYDVPDISPSYSQLGPLTIGTWNESRTWSLAIDAVSTNNPSSNTGGWTNPTNAYADGTNYANITSGAPSASHTYGTYGFSLGTDTISQVRVRYDALSIGGASLTQTKSGASITSDIDNTGGFTTAPLFSAVNDNSDATFIIGKTNGGGDATFGFNAFTIPTGSAITSIQVNYRARSTTTSTAQNSAGNIRVNGTIYRATGRAAPASSAAIQAFTDTWTTNPNTTAAWTVDDINGSGASPLQAFGVGGSDFNPDVNFYEVSATVNYTTANNEQISVDVSWDGGGSWSSVQTTDLTGSEATYWYDVTAATAWTATKLNDTNFQVRVVATTVGDTGDVRLDWIPVEVTHTPPITISGTANGNDGATVKVAINNTLQAQTGTISSSAWSIANVPLPIAGDVITVWVDNVADGNESSAITKYISGTTVSGMVLNTNVLTSGSNQNTYLYASVLNAYDCTEDEDIMFQAANNHLKVEGDNCQGSVNNSYSSEEFDILASNAHYVYRDDSITTYDLTITGNLEAYGTGTINVEHDWANTGTFVANNSTVNLTGADSSTQTLSGSTIFYNLAASTSANSAGRTITFTAGTTQEVTGTWTVTGFSGKVITLGSTTTAAWNIIPNQAAATYTATSYSTNLGPAFCASYSTNSGNNNGWNINAGATCSALYDTGYSWQRKTWHDGTRYWRSSHDYANAKIKFEYSADGSSWNEDTSAAISTDTSDFSIQADSSAAYIAYKTDSKDGETVLNNDANLVGYWKMNESSWNGTTGEVLDETTNNLDGTAVGNATTTGSGYYNNSGTFDGTGDSVTVTDGTSSPLDFTGNFTLSAWVARSGGTNGYIITKFDTSANGGFAILHGTNGEVYCRTDNGSSGYVDSYSDTGYVNTDSAWHHLIAVRTGNSCRVWIDGIDQTLTTGVHTTLGVNNTALTIGEQPSGGNAFSGKIDEARIYDRALSDNEIRELYGPGYNIEVRKATSYPGTGFAWSDESVALDGSASSDYYQHPVITQDTNSKLWIGAVNNSYTYYVNTYLLEAIRSTNASDITAWDTASTLDSSVNANKYGVIVPRTSGDAQAIWIDGAAVESKNYTTGSWDGSPTSVGTGTPSLTTSLSAVGDSSGNIHFTYINSSNQTVYRQYTSSWQTAVTLDSSSGNSHPTISLNSNNNNLYAFWIRGSHIYYKIATTPYSSGDWDVSATDWQTVGTNISPTSNYTDNGNIYAIWSDTGALEWAKLDFTSSSTASSFQRKTWYDGTRYWRSTLDNNDARIEFEYSTDGASWTEDTSARIDTDTSDFSIQATSTEAHISYKKGSVTNEDDILTANLIGHWKMNEASWNGTSNEVIDSSSNAKHGTRGGDATTSSTAKFDRAGTFDGTGDYVDMGDQTEHDLSFPLTISAWVYLTELPSTKGTESEIISKWNASPNRQFTFSIGTDNVLYFFKSHNGTNGEYGSTSGYTFTSGDLNVWRHIGYTVDASGLATTYIDGTSVDTAQFTNLTFYTGAATNMRIGYRNNNINPFKGNMDDVRIYNTDLSSDQISTLALPGYDIEVRSATTYPGTGFSWSNPTVAFNGSSATDYYQYPVITQDTNSKIWVGAARNNSSTYTFNASRSTSASDITAWDTATSLDSSANSNKYGIIVPRTTADMQAIYIDGTGISSKNYTSGSWDGAPTSIATGVTGLTTTLSAVGDSSGNVHLAYIDSSNHTVYQEYTSSWQTAVTLDSNTGNEYPTISINSNDDVLYAMWIRGNHIYYNVGYSDYTSLNWDSNATDWQTVGTNTYISSNYSDAGLIFAEWTSGTSPAWEQITVRVEDASISSSFQRKTWYDGTRYWRSILDNNDNRIEFEYSTDGTSWTEDTSARINTNTSDFSIQATSTEAYISYKTGAVTNEDNLLTSDLAAWWKLDETSYAGDCSTADVIDSSGNAINGTACPNTTAPSPIAGKFGNAVDLDGSEDYISMGNTTTIETLTEASVCTWMKYDPASVTTDGAMVSRYSGSVDGWILWVDDDAAISGRTNTVSFAVDPGGTTGRVEGSTNLVTTAQWDHYCGVFKGGQYIRLYKNGALDTEETSSIVATVRTDTANLYLGRIDNATPRYLDGKLDDVRIFNRALTDNEVKTLANPGYDIEVRKASSYPGTSFTWSNPTVAFPGASATDYYQYPVLAQDTNSKIWVGAARNNSSTYTFNASRSTSASAITAWDTATSLDSSANSNKYGSLASGLSGAVYATWIDSTTIEGKNYNGSVWDGAPTSIATGTTGLTTTLSTLGDSNGYTHLLYIDDSGYTTYRKYITSWSSPATLDANAGNAYPTLTLNTTDGDLYAFWIRGDDIFYKKGDFLSGGNALLFDGTADYVNVPYNASLDYANTLTIEFWFTPGTTIDTGLSTYKGILSKAFSNTDSENDWVFFWESTEAGKLRFGTYGDNVKTTNDTWTAGTWYHMAVTVDGSNNAYIYVNGVQDNFGGDTSVNGDPINGTQNTPLNIGLAKVASGDQYFEGKIDDVRIYNAARTAAQIKSDMYSELVGNETNLQAYWNMNEGTGQTVGDSTSNAYDGTLGADSGSSTDDPSWTSTIPFANSWDQSTTSWKTSGTNTYLTSNYSDADKVFGEWTDGTTIAWDKLDLGTNTAPNSPTSLAQKTTGDVTLSTGDWTNTTSVKFTATATDSDNPDTLYLCVEKDILGVAFSNTEDSCGSGVAYSGAGVTVTHTITSQTDASEYHWQARTKDTAGEYSAWVSYDVNAESARDYGLDTTAPTGGTVYDGTSAGVDATFSTTSLSSLSANWASINTDVSGLLKYEYSIGTTVGGVDIKGWTDNSTTTSVTSTDLTLQSSSMYYVNVRTTDNAGNVSSVITSNGQLVAPSISFTIAPASLTFNPLNFANSYSDTQNTTLTTSTNAYNGYVVRAFVTDYLRSTDTISTIADFSSGSYATPATWAGAEIGFGYTSNDTTIGGSDKFGSGTLYAPFSHTGPGDIVADHTNTISGTPVSNEVFTITYKVKTEATQAAKNYSTTTIYTATAQY